SERKVSVPLEFLSRLPKPHVKLLRLETPCVVEQFETAYKPSQGLKRSQAVAKQSGQGIAAPKSVSASQVEGAEERFEVFLFDETEKVYRNKCDGEKEIVRTEILMACQASASTEAAFAMPSGHSHQHGTEHAVSTCRLKAHRNGHGGRICVIFGPRRTDGEDRKEGETRSLMFLLA
ncbi:hypothetical protein K438DRAFT_1784952, partial [Mycena galopus ATCC 62051]